MKVCSFDTSHCHDEGGPPCSARLASAEAEPLRELATRLLDRSAEVAARLAPEHPLASESDARALLRAVSQGAAHELALLFRASGRRVPASGASLQSALGDANALVEACLGVLAGAGVDASGLAAARRQLAMLAEAQVLLEACALDGAGTVATTPEPGGGPGMFAIVRGHRSGLVGLIGQSEPMQRLYDRIELASRGRETVLVTGESGSGKELVARAIHAVSGDPHERFVAVNCAALPRELMESELFGHRRGAFSGAHEQKPGLVGAAAGGTLFLDEVSELAAEAQAKLLRVIQERAVRAVGDTREVAVDLRIIAATNQRPEDLLATGRLRRDLYYRLARFVVPVPALRERRADIGPLAAHLVARWARSRGVAVPRLSPAVVEQLELLDWPGNVRELENAVIAASSAARGVSVTLSDLPALGTAAEAPAAAAALPPRTLRDAERETIARVLHEAGGNKAAASRILGISRKQLYVKIREYGLAV